MNAKLKKLFETTRQLQITILNGLLEVKNSGSIEETTDTVYALREISEMLNHARIEVDKTNKVAKSMFCLQYLVDNRDKVETEYCTATPKIGQIPKFPYKRNADPEQFDKILVEFLQVPKQVAERELVRIHYPEFVKYFNECVLESKPIPGISLGETLIEHDVLIRRKKDIC